MPTLLSTTVDEAILGIVSKIQAGVSYKVYDGMPSHRPDPRVATRYLVIGAETLDNAEDWTSAANMDQTWAGLGGIARDENLFIHCVSVGIGKSIAGARAVAKAVVDDVRTLMTLHPSTNTYNALVDQITSVRSKNVQGGAIVQMEFIIKAEARIRDA